MGKCHNTDAFVLWHFADSKAAGYENVREFLQFNSYAAYFRILSILVWTASHFLLEQLGEM